MARVYLGFSVEDLVRESNRIEGIHRDPTDAEMQEFHRFMDLAAPNVADVVTFVSVYQPNAVLRDKSNIPGVRVGRHIAPPSGPDIRARLDHLLRCAVGATMTSWEVHTAYETLHPFTDGNGRSGRMLWHWQMREAPIGFLHRFYYQTLDQLNVRLAKAASGVSTDE